MSQSIKLMKKNSLILQALREIFCRNIAELFPHVFMTITRLDMYDKEGIVQVYISFICNADGESIIDQLNENKTMIRGLLGKRLASKLRIIPSLKFYLDTALDEAFHVLNLIKQVSSTP